MTKLPRADVDPDFRADEMFAAIAVSRALGARVIRHDRPGGPGAPQRAVDAVIIYPDEREAALEFTSVESEATHRLRSRIAKLSPEDAPGQLTWSIHPATVSDLERLHKIFRRVILLVEGHGLRRLDELPADVNGPKSRRRVRAYGDPRPP